MVSSSRPLPSSAPAMSLPANQLPIGEGVGPDGQTRVSFFVDLTALEILQRDGPTWKYEDARFIEEAVRDPDAIFHGLQRLGQEDSYCYSVRPSRDPDDPDSSTLPRYGQAFAVYLFAGVGGYVVFDWEWRTEDEEPGHPAGWEDDFTRRAWRRT